MKAKDYNIVQVVFNYNSVGTEKVYNYKNEDYVFKPGDFAVVLVGQDFKVVKVVEILQNNFENASEVNKATSYIISPVLMENHERRSQAKDRIKYIKQQLAEKQAQMEEFQMYDAIAARDEGTKALVEELKTLIS